MWHLWLGFTIFFFDSYTCDGKSDTWLALDMCQTDSDALPLKIEKWATVFEDDAE
jgi:hypothetical protein